MSVMVTENDPVLHGFDPDLDALIARVGPCRLQGASGLTPYEALLQAIVGQQLHGRAAEAILGRVKALTGDVMPTPSQLLACPEPLLRGAGLSGAKLVAMRGVAQAWLDGIVPDLEEAATLEDEALIARLVPLRGIGRWTVQMMLMFTLGRPDVMPIDDYGVRAGWRRLKGLDALPTPAVLGRATVGFAPWRSALAWYLWRAAEEGRGAGTALTGG